MLEITLIFWGLLCGMFLIFFSGTYTIFAAWAKDVEAGQGRKPWITAVWRLLGLYDRRYVNSDGFLVSSYGVQVLGTPVHPYSYPYLYPYLHLHLSRLFTIYHIYHIYIYIIYNPYQALIAGPLALFYAWSTFEKHPARHITGLITSVIQVYSQLLYYATEMHTNFMDISTSHLELFIPIFIVINLLQLFIPLLVLYYEAKLIINRIAAADQREKEFLRSGRRLSDIKLYSSSSSASGSPITPLGSISTSHHHITISYYIISCRT
jgi:hypothetical protein